MPAQNRLRQAHDGPNHAVPNEGHRHGKETKAARPASQHAWLQGPARTRCSPRAAVAATSRAGRDGRPRCLQTFAGPGPRPLVRSASLEMGPDL